MATKPKPKAKAAAKAKEEPVKVPVKAAKAADHQPIRVDGRNRRTDDDALEGHFVDVVDGEHKGRYGVFEHVLEHDKKTGYPVKIIVRSRDEHNQLLPVAYKDARPAVAGRR